MVVVSHEELWEGVTGGFMGQLNLPNRLHYARRVLHLFSKTRVRKIEAGTFLRKEKQYPEFLA